MWEGQEGSFQEHLATGGGGGGRGLKTRWRRPDGFVMTTNDILEAHSHCLALTVVTICMVGRG